MTESVHPLHLLTLQIFLRTVLISPWRKYVWKRIKTVLKNSVGSLSNVKCDSSFFRLHKRWSHLNIYGECEVTSNKYFFLWLILFEALFSHFRKWVYVVTKFYFPSNFRKCEVSPHFCWLNITNSKNRLY